MLKYISLDELNCVVFDIDVSIEYTSKLVCDEQDKGRVGGDEDEHSDEDDELVLLLLIKLSLN